MDVYRAPVRFVKKRCTAISILHRTLKCRIFIVKVQIKKLYCELVVEVRSRKLLQSRNVARIAPSVDIDFI